MLRKSSLIFIPVLAATSILALTGCSGSSTTNAASDTGANSASPQASVDRMAATEMSSGLVDTVTLVNNLSQPVTVRVEEVDGFDWNGDRPDREAPQGFEQQTINPGGTITRVLGPTHSKWVDGAPFTPVFLDAGGKELARVALQKVFVKELRINPNNAKSEWFFYMVGWSVRGASTIANEVCPQTVTSSTASIGVICNTGNGTTVTISN